MRHATSWSAPRVGGMDIATLCLADDRWKHAIPLVGRCTIQLFSQKSRTPTVAKEFQIGLYDPAEADLEHFWICRSDGIVGDRL